MESRSSALRARASLAFALVLVVALCGGHAFGQGTAISTAVSDIGRPFSVAVRGGVAYIADPSTHTVWQVTLSSGAKVAVAGTGEQGFNGDGIAATLAQLDNPSGVALDPTTGELYIADTGNHAIRKIATPGVAGALITTVAGIPTVYGVGDATLAACTDPAFDKSQCVPATSLRLFGPRGIAVDGSGNVYIADRMNQRIVKLDKATGFLFAVAGVAGFPGSNDDCVIECGAGTPPARFNSPVGVAVDSNGNIYVADEGNNAIRVISNGLVSTFGFFDLPAGTLLRPTGVLPLNSFGDSVLVADYGHNRILRLNCGDGCRVQTIAGIGKPGFSGDGGLATLAQLNSPIGITVDGTALYIADLLNGRIRQVGSNLNCSAPTDATITRAGPDQFNGVDTFVTLSDGNFGTGPFSLAGWVNWSGGSTVQNIFRKSNFPVSGPGAGYWIRISSGTTLEFFIGETVGIEGAPRTLVTTTVFAPSAYHFVTGTKDATGAMRLYVDGKVAGTGTIDPTFNVNTDSPFTLGAWNDRFGPTEFFVGTMRDIAVFNRAITDQEVQALFNVGSGLCGG